MAEGGRGEQSGYLASGLAKNSNADNASPQRVREGMMRLAQSNIHQGNQNESIQGKW